MKGKKHLVCHKTYMTIGENIFPPKNYSQPTLISETIQKHLHVLKFLISFQCNTTWKHWVLFWGGKHEF